MGSAAAFSARGAGIIGMTIAVLATVFGPRVSPAGYAWIIGALVVGGSIGLFAAKKVQMTQMPELVALMHSLVGLAACLVLASSLGFSAKSETFQAWADAKKSGKALPFPDFTRGHWK